MSKLVVITRKIQLVFDTSDKKEVKEIWKTLYRWQHICHKAANYIASHQFMLQNEADLIYLKEETKVKLADFGKDPLGILTTTKQNATYQLLSKKFKGEIHTGILTALNSVVIKSYNKEQKDYFLGNKSLRSYKSTIPIPFQASGVKDVRHVIDKYKGVEYNNYAFNLYGLPLRTMFGRDLSNNKFYFQQGFSREFLPEYVWELEDAFSEAIKTKEGENQILKIADRIFDFQQIEIGEEGEYYYKVTHGDLSFRMDQKINNNAPVWRLVSDYKLCDSSIMIDENKVFLLAAFQFTATPAVLNPNITAECWLDVEIPIQVRIGAKAFEIGNKEEFLFRRQAIQESVRRLQRSAAYNHGNGQRKFKLQSLKQISGKEAEYVSQKTHMYARKLINLCLKYRCKSIVLMEQKEKEGEAKDKPEFLLRNWSYYDLITKIMYKANQFGMDVVVR